MEAYLKEALEIVKAQASVRTMTEEEITTMVKTLAEGIKNISECSVTAEDAAVDALSLIHISTLKLACLQVDSRFKLIKSSGGGGAEVCLVKKVLLTHTRPESPHHPARK